jgi:hypothetical protein
MINRDGVIKSVCVGGVLIEHYSPKNFIEVKAVIDRYVGLKSKSIIRMVGKFTINYQGFIHWN